MTIRRISQSEIRKVGRPGTPRDEDLPPAGIAPVLRASWRFARDTARRFNQELLSDRAKQFLAALAKRF